MTTMEQIADKEVLDFCQNASSVPGCENGTVTVAIATDNNFWRNDSNYHFYFRKKNSAKYVTVQFSSRDTFVDSRTKMYPTYRLKFAMLSNLRKTAMVKICEPNISGRVDISGPIPDSYGLVPRNVQVVNKKVYSDFLVVLADIVRQGVEEFLLSPKWPEPIVCPKCFSTMRVRIRRATNSAFLGCGNYPNCTFTLGLSEENKQKFASYIEQASKFI